MNIKLGKAYKLSRRMKFRGLDVSIETDKGELRHWYDPHNKTKGSTKMSHPYGYIRRTKGVDGDHVDVYIGPKEDAPNVYVVHQMKAPDFKKYDEDKCMVGFENAAAAKAAYLKNFDDPRFFGSMTTMPWAEFEKKVKATFEQPKKIAYHCGQENVMTPLQKAYALGQHLAKEAFEKQAQGLLGSSPEKGPPYGNPEFPGPGTGETQMERPGYGGTPMPSKPPTTLETRPPMDGMPQPRPPVGGPAQGKFGSTKEAGPRIDPRLINMLGGAGAGALTGAHAAPEDERLRAAIAGGLLGSVGGGVLGRHMDQTALGRLVGVGAGGVIGGGLGQKLVTKQGEAALGDPNFWGGGTPPPDAVPTPAQTAEEAVQMLPAGTFQGAQIKITPDGQRSTTVKVTPDAVAQPDALAGVFAAEPAAKVEISQPEQQAVPGGGEAPAMPPPGMEGLPPEAAAEAGKMAALKALGLR